MSSKCNRRSFIKKSSIGATGLALGGLAGSTRKALGYVPGDQINPNIDNLRVVYALDNALTTGAGPVSGWTNQNAVTNDAVVDADIDKLARALAERDNITEAWQTIFRKPPGKQWNQVVAAIKTNNINEQHTRNAVMKKMCEVLVNYLGVLGSNIHIYDATHGGNMLTKTPWYNLPAGVRIESRWGGRTASVALPAPLSGYGTMCQGNIASGAVDILVNIALCKGHSSSFGTLTMCLKNHYGTLDPSCGKSVNVTNYLLAINKTEAVLGAMDPGTGRIVFPRQQLCLIDCLWASRGGPSGEPSTRPNRFFMGTFGPAVDYQVATKFRRDEMGWSINSTVVNRFLTEFGYGPGDLPNGGDMIDALTWEPSQPSMDADPRWGLYQ